MKKDENEIRSFYNKELFYLLCENYKNMKTNYLLKLTVAFCWVISVLNANAQCAWESVGPSDTNSVGFSAGVTKNTTIAFNPSTNNPYVVYSDGGNSNKATVMKYDGTNWVNVGTAGFSAGAVQYTSIAFNPSTNEPYVVYQDEANSKKTTVMKFDGTSWVTVGIVGFSAGAVNATSIVFNPSTNEPYVLYQDGGSSYKATVMRFNGTSWGVVGTVGFTPGEARFCTIAFNPATNEPYVAYRDEANGSKASVMKFDGTNWVNVGAVGFSPSFADFTFIAFNPSTNEPYVACRSTASKASVMRFDGTNWVNVGTDGFSAGSIYFLTMAFNPSTNEPYVAFRDDGGNSAKATAMKFDGTNWTTVGSAGFTAGAADYPAIAFNPSTNEPYIVCSESNGAFVFRFGMKELSSMTGATSTCASSNEVYSVENITGTTYSWTLPTGWTGTSTTNSIQVVSGTAGGTISVYATSTCGRTNTLALNVNIKAASASTDVQTACESYTWIDGNSYSTSTNTPTFVLTNAAGCDSTVTLNLTIGTVDNSVAQNGATLTANAIGATYQWIDCEKGNVVITGATSQSYIAEANGRYAVIVTENGCTDTSSCMTVSKIGVDSHQSNTFSVFPNPNAGSFTVQLDKIYGNATVSIKDTSGRIWQIMEANNQQNVQLNVNVPTGMYFVQVTTEDGKSTITKMVIE